MARLESTVTKAEPDDNAGGLVAALNKLNLASSDVDPLSPPNLAFSVVKSSASVDILRHPAVKFVHGDVDGDVYLENIKAWARDSHDKIAKSESEIPEGLSQGDLYRMIEQLQAGSVSVTPGDRATFLYNEEDDYDTEDPAKGLFRGYLVVRVAKHIWTAPSSASKSKAGAGKSTRANNAKLHRMKRFTGRQIAYIVVQTWFALSSMESWDPDAENFSLKELFNLTVELFEDDPTSDWAVSTLAFFDEQVFGRRASEPDDQEEQPAPRPVSTAERMRRMRAKAKATPASSGSGSGDLAQRVFDHQFTESVFHPTRFISFLVLYLRFHGLFNVVYARRRRPFLSPFADYPLAAVLKIAPAPRSPTPSSLLSLPVSPLACSRMDCIPIATHCTVRFLDLFYFACLY
ncbi:hypothetical protein FIBSPDRAFT_1046648 [Athelia psychrophila]|uniref:Fungal-type protein kinase domain-containing protein n=1 Tax=Athelia psychrophila TaxID=1759441 RepID=A0A166GFX8_9AGAM|nr:hypothetical protein FIBSPDRAFT_1046648 [Fibularhizoctonia sp. CBS 109695]